jgi:choline dehydrogenase-like flavoprotein
MSRPATVHDFVVVGAGVAGSVLAARLSEREGVRVLLLEAGGSTPPPESAIPGLWPALSATEWNWGDFTPSRSAVGRAIAVPRGRGLGGSSVINGMVFVRGHRDCYAAWEEVGGKGWGFDDLLPFFKRSETAAGRDPALRGVDGPLVVAPADPLNEVHAACLSAAVESGHRWATDISGGLEVGFGPVDLNIVDGKRQSAADAYLWPAAERPNLEVVTSAMVNRLVIKGGRCVGVEYVSGPAGEVSRAFGGEVILAAGAIGSPQVLMSSGIGPHAHLREVGVDVELDLPGVGSNLQDHAWVMIAHRAARPVPPARNNHGEVIGLLHSGITSGAPDLQIIFSDSAGRQFTGVDGIDHGYAIGVCMLRPFSRGTVRLSRSGARPVVDPGYFRDDRDMRVMLAGLRLARHIGRASALDPWRGEEVSPGPDIESDEDLREWVLRNFTSYTHLVGTCAMGDTERSVVDAELRVRGIDGLRVADASVMPTVPSNNTVATVYALAERAAELIVLG